MISSVRTFTTLLSRSTNYAYQSQSSLSLLSFTLCRNLSCRSNVFHQFPVEDNGSSGKEKGRRLNKNTSLLHYVPNRLTSFFVKISAQALWAGVTGVSNAGRKRGRGKGVGKKVAKDLNKGQVIGIGKVNMLWPGLNAPVIQGKELLQHKPLPADPDRESRLIKMRDTMGKFRPLRLNPLERGWSGTRMAGRSVGCPDPIGQDTFEDFDTKILEMKTVTNMDGNVGRRRRYSVVAFTGNKNGLIGFALATSPDGRGALKRAKNRAAQKLLYIERYNEHTVLHDFHTQFGQTQVFVYKKPEGFGLVCHRAIRNMCELIGIKDIYAKLEGSHNLQHMIKAFILGLLRQKTHTQIAEEKGLYLVEQREENYYYPKVVAAPSLCRSEENIPYDETMDFSQIGMNDRVVLQKKPFVPFYTKLDSWQNHLLKTEWKRNHEQVKIELAKEYGPGKNHLTAKYPECDLGYYQKVYEARKAEQEAQEADE